jgi:hypothetical protein
LRHQASVFPGDAYVGRSFSKRHKKQLGDPGCELPLSARLGLPTVTAKFRIGFQEGKPHSKRQIEIREKAGKKDALKLLGSGWFHFAKFLITGRDQSSGESSMTIHRLYLKRFVNQTGLPMCDRHNGDPRPNLQPYIRLFERAALSAIACLS